MKMCVHFELKFSTITYQIFPLHDLSDWYDLGHDLAAKLKQGAPPCSPNSFPIFDLPTLSSLSRSACKVLHRSFSVFNTAVLVGNFAMGLRAKEGFAKIWLTAMDFSSHSYTRAI